MNNDLTNLMEQDFEQNLASSVEKIDDGGLSTVAVLHGKSGMKNRVLPNLTDNSRKKRNLF